MRASRYSRKRSNFDVTRRGLRSAGASPWSSRRTVFRSRPVTRAISLMLFPLTQASWMSMNSPRPTISRDLLLQRELLQQETRTPGLGWGISDRRYLGSFTPALTRAGHLPAKRMKPQTPKPRRLVCTVRPAVWIYLWKGAPVARVISGTRWSGRDCGQGPKIQRGVPSFRACGFLGETHHAKGWF